MSELTLFVLKIVFLAVLWLFIFGIVYALRSDLFGQRVRKLQGQPAGAAAPAPAPAPAAPAPAAAPRAAAPAAPVQAPSAPRTPPTPMAAGGFATVHNTNRLVITSGPKRGTEIALGNEPLTIGRSGESSIVIRDDYSSTHHARLLIWNDEWMIQDLDSTNGTFLAGARVGVPTQVPLDTPIKVGTTTFELRR